MQVALVSVEDLDSLCRAYPNYYVDTKGFMDSVDEELGLGQRQWVLPMRTDKFDVPIIHILRFASLLQEWPSASDAGGSPRG
jgi:hypothetical protein